VEIKSHSPANEKVYRQNWNLFKHFLTSVGLWTTIGYIEQLRRTWSKLYGWLQSVDLKG
jgi:hypothetical protein